MKITLVILGIITWLFILSLCKMGYYAKRSEKEEIEFLKNLFNKESV
jgi:uncharacterized membrane protein